jgi:hypothetical protein
VVKLPLTRSVKFFLLMALFSLKIVTIAVALLVDKSQLSAIGPDPA